MKISAIENIQFDILEGGEQDVFTAPRLVGNNMVLSINTELEDCGSYEI
jgi:hypothetical protein